MDEGWLGNDYLILFTDPEIVSASERYAISQLLPGYQVVGLRGWDDFIVRVSAGHAYLVPTVPVELQHMSPFSLPENTLLQADERFRGKIKWYLKPIAFGGDPNAGDNVIWVSHEQHAGLVKWWNEKYRSLTKNP